MTGQQFAEIYRVRGARERAMDAGLRGQPLPNLAKWDLTDEQRTNVADVYAAARELGALMTATPDPYWRPIWTPS